MLLAGLVAVGLLSAACAYVVGYAFIAPSDSVLRTREGGLVLAACVLLALAVPLALTDLLSSGTLGTWPKGFGPGAFRTMWVVVTTTGLLSGLRAWRMRFGRGGAGFFTFDESPVGRALGQLPLADSLEAALDVLARETSAVRDLGPLSDAIRSAGSRFWHQLPEKDGEVYQLVREHVPPAVASEVTRFLLEGSHRKQRS